MISLLCWLVVLGAAAALPTHLQSRQDWSLGYYSYELSTFGCKPVIFVFAKATYEPGNIGNTVGPHMSDGLKAAFGVRNVVTQGVDYWGFMETNFYPGGAPPWGIYDMQLLLTAAAACPDSKIVASGYSQGAALVHRAIEGLSEEVKSKIAGVVTFGDTQTYQDGGRIKGYPQNDTLIICNVGDVICTGTLYVFPIHFDYVKWVPTAVLFLTQKLLQANEEHPWPDDAFAFPGITTTTTTLAPQPSVPYTLPTGKPTGKPTWRPSTPAISGLPTPPTPGFPIPTAPESLTPSHPSTITERLQPRVSESSVENSVTTTTTTTKAAIRTMTTASRLSSGFPLPTQVPEAQDGRLISVTNTPIMSTMPPMD